MVQPATERQRRGVRPPTASPHHKPSPRAHATGPDRWPLPLARTTGSQTPYRLRPAHSRAISPALSLYPPPPPPPPPPPRYADINLALNALESAFIQLTGKAEAKGQFFPQMRKRIAARGHKVADYEVCL